MYFLLSFFFNPWIFIGTEDSNKILQTQLRSQEFEFMTRFRAWPTKASQFKIKCGRQKRTTFGDLVEKTVNLLISYYSFKLVWLLPSWDCRSNLSVMYKETFFISYPRNPQSHYYDCKTKIAYFLTDADHGGGVHYQLLLLCLVLYHC